MENELDNAVVCTGTDVITSCLDLSLTIHSLDAHVHNLPSNNCREICFEPSRSAIPNLLPVILAALELYGMDPVCRLRRISIRDLNSSTKIIIIQSVIWLH